MDAPPILGDSSTGGIVDDLQGPAQLKEEVVVSEGGHVGVSPCVDGHVLVGVGVSLQEKLGVGEDVGANVEVGSTLVVLLQKVIEPGSWREGAIVEAGGRGQYMRIYSGVQGRKTHEIPTVPLGASQNSISMGPLQATVEEQTSGPAPSLSS